MGAKRMNFRGAGGFMGGGRPGPYDRFGGGGGGGFGGRGYGGGPRSGFERRYRGEQGCKCPSRSSPDFLFLLQ